MSIRQVKALRRGFTPQFNGVGTQLGQVVSLSENSTTTSATVPNTDTNVKTYSLGANTYSKIVVRANITIVSQGTSSAQDVTVKIKVGNTSKDYVVTIAAAAAVHVRSLYLQAAQTSSGTVAVSHGAAAADANTTTNVLDLSVVGVI
jgi:hypothetical protein